jgi:tetratricopeptide (TPR) repeat protein
MKLMRFLSVLGVTTLLGYVGLPYVMGATATHERNCQTRKVDRDVAVAACTALIDSGRYHGEDLGTLHFRRAAHFHSFEGWPQAAADYAKAIEHGGRMPGAYHNRAALHLLYSDDAEAAVADFTALLDVPNLKRRAANDALMGRAHAYAKLDRDSEAQADLDRLLEVVNDKAFVHVMKATFHRRAGDLDLELVSHKNAIAEYQITLAENPAAQQAKEAMRSMFENLGLKKEPADLDAAARAQIIALIDMALTREGGHALLYQLRGQANMMAETVQGGLLAVEDFTKAIALEPAANEHLVARAMAYWQASQIELAIADLDVAIERSDPFRPQAMARRQNVKDLSVDASDAAKAEAALAHRQDMDDFHDYRGGLKIRARIFTQAARFEAAIADLTTVVDLDENDIEVRFFRGFSYASNGQIQDALADLDAAVAIHNNPKIRSTPWSRQDKNIAGLYAFRSAIHKNLGDLDGAVEDAVRSMQRVDEATVRATQSDMKTAGFYVGSLTGKMDAQTEKALRAFLKAGYAL